MSVELLEKMAPSQLVATHTTNVSMLLAATTTTRSPCLTPLAWYMAAASLAAPARSSAHEHSRSADPPSRTSVMATLPSSLWSLDRRPLGSAARREYRTFSAKFRRTPSNHRGTWSMVADSSTTRA